MTAKIEIEELKDFVILHLKGDFNGPEEMDALYDAFKNISKKENVKVLVDLKEVVFLNSGSIGTLLSGNSMIKKTGGKVVLYNTSDYLENLFNITKLNLAFDIHKDKDDAEKVLMT